LRGGREGEAKANNHKNTKENYLFNQVRGTELIKLQKQRGEPTKESCVSISLCFVGKPHN